AVGAHAGEQAGEGAQALAARAARRGEVGLHFGGARRAQGVLEIIERVAGLQMPAEGGLGLHRRSFLRAEGGSTRVAPGAEYSLRKVGDPVLLIPRRR